LSNDRPRWLRSQSIESCAGGSNGKQWQCAVLELAVGGAVARIVAVAVVAGGMDLGEEGRDSIHLDRADGGRAAGTEDVGGQPCRHEALAAVEEGVW